METNKVELQKVREFGDVFNATFAFIKQEIKPLGISLLVFVLPVILLLSTVMVVFTSMSFGTFSRPDLVGTSTFFIKFAQLYLVIIVLAILLQTMIMVTVYSYLSLYLKDKENTGIPEMFAEIRTNFFPVLGASILGGLVIIVGLVFCVLPGIYLAVCLSMFITALVIEKKGIGNAFSRSFELSHKQWGWTFLIIFVSFILMYVISFVLSIPGLIIGFASVFSNFQNPVNPYEKYGIVYIVYSSIVSSITYLLCIIPALLIAFQYFNIVESMEKHSLIKEINEIGKEE